MATTNGSTDRLASVRCPYCGDLFAPEGGAIPTHYLDNWALEAQRCRGSELPAGGLQ